MVNRRFLAKTNFFCRGFSDSVGCRDFEEGDFQILLNLQTSFPRYSAINCYPLPQFCFADVKNEAGHDNLMNCKSSFTSTIAPDAGLDTLAPRARSTSRFLASQTIHFSLLWPACANASRGPIARIPAIWARGLKHAMLPPPSLIYYSLLILTACVQCAWVCFIDVSFRFFCIFVICILL